MSVFRTVAILSLLLAIVCTLPFAVAYAGGWNFERGEDVRDAAATAVALALAGGVGIVVFALSRSGDSGGYIGLSDSHWPKSDSTQNDATKPNLSPTAQQINSACLSYDHAFGLMSKDEQERMRFQATEWLRAWQKEGAWQWRK